MQNNKLNLKHKEHQEPQRKQRKNSILKLIVPFIVFQLVTVIGLAQNNDDFSSRPKRGQFSLVAYLGGGPAYYISQRGIPGYLQTNVTRWNPMGTVRVMWHPDHLLKLGLETGHVRFYSYRFKDSANKEGRITLDARPLLLEWSMSLKSRINIFAGSGLYILKTKLDYDGEAKTTKLSVGWMLAASYIYPLGKEVGLGTEIKWLYAAETSNGTIGAQLQLVWRFFKW